MSRCAIYARCSSVKEGEKDPRIPAQLDAVGGHALRSGNEIVAEYINGAEGARTADRPLGLPLDLTPYADPTWGPLPIKIEALVREVLRHSIVAGLRRGEIAPGPVDSANLPPANEAELRAAGRSLELIVGVPA